MDIRLPQVAEGADSGTVVTLLVAPGDAITKDQDLLEVETDKAVVSIPSPAAGTVRQIHVKEGDTVKVGQVLLSLAGAEASVASGAEAPAALEPAPAPRPAAPPTPAPAPVAPVAAAPVNPDPVAPPGIRKLARNLGIDLTRVPGSGRGGRILMEDVRAYVEGLQALAARPPTGPPPAAEAPASTPAPPAVDFSKWGQVERQPLSPLRRIVRDRMHGSWVRVPHVTQFDNADITKLLALRKKLVPEYEKAGARLTVTPFVLQALAATLQQYPRFNSSLDGDELVLKRYIHIGIAVDTDAGLMVPVIRDVDKKSLLELAQETERLAEQARSRKIAPAELHGGSFTISNQGALGGAHFTPIVNHPEVAILGLGRGAVQPVWVDGKPTPRTILPIALSFDHRVVDGADAVRFVRDLVQRLEQPDDNASALKTAGSVKKGR